MVLTFSTFFPSVLGSVHISFYGRGATTNIILGSGSYSAFSVSYSYVAINNTYISKTYIKNNTSNEPIYISNEGGASFDAMINVVGFTYSVGSTNNLPSGYTSAY